MKNNSYNICVRIINTHLKVKDFHAVCACRLIGQRSNYVCTCHAMCMHSPIITGVGLFPGLVYINGISEMFLLGSNFAFNADDLSTILLAIDDLSTILLCYFKQRAVGHGGLL